MGKFSSSLALVKLAFKIIIKEKELLVYSILSGLASIAVFISFFIFLFGLSFSGVIPAETEGGGLSLVLEFVFSLLFYFVLTFVALFFNTAIITSVDRIVRGEENSFGDGIKSAFSNIGIIFKWALVSAFVSTILKMIQNRVPFIAKIVIGIVGIAWNLATYFAFPVMLFKKTGPMDALKQAPGLFKKGWGEAVIMNIGTGFCFMIMFFILFGISAVVVILGIVTGMTFLVFIAGISLALGFILLILLSTTTDAVIKTLLYIYVDKESLPEYVDLDILGQVFKEKEVKN
jgi:hypothetical protein